MVLVLSAQFYLNGSEEGDHVGGDDDEAEAGAERQEPEVEDHSHGGNPGKVVVAISESGSKSFRRN